MSVKVQCQNCKKFNTLETIPPDDAPVTCEFCQAPLESPSAHRATCEQEALAAAAANKPQTRKIYWFSDRGAALALLGAAVVLTVVYILCSKGKNSEVNEKIQQSLAMIQKKQAAHAKALKAAAKKKNAKNANKKNTPAKPKVVFTVGKPQRARLSAQERARRENFKPLQITVKGNGLDFKRPADFVCDTIKHIGSDGKPEKINEAWSGPQDLSMKVWLGHDGSALHIKVEVTDNLHMQLQGDSGSMWKDDSLQIALAGDNNWSRQWELGFSLQNDQRRYSGKVFMFPDHLKAQYKKVLAQGVSVSRYSDKTVYELKLPLNLLGIDAKMLLNGIRFNALANDTDALANHRKCWVKIASGIAEDKDPYAFPVVKFEK